eukprot:11824948-Prorocentrum_lima.AAC.1
MPQATKERSCRSLNQLIKDVDGSRPHPPSGVHHEGGKTKSAVGWSRRSANPVFCESPSG